MELAGKLARARWPRWLSGFLGAAMLLAVVVSATAEPPDRLKRGRGLAAAPQVGSTVMNRNRAILILANGRGQAGSIASGSSVGSGGFWITTQNPYIFAAGVTVGATIPGSGGNTVDTVAFIGGPFSQVEPGSTIFPELDQIAGAGIVWDTADPSDAANFPAECTVDDFRLALFPTLAPFAGQPFPGFADQTACMATTDSKGPICDDCAGTRMGIDVVSTWWAFSVPLVQDFVFVAFRIYNTSQFVTASNAPAQVAGPYDLTDMSVAIAIDPDVGDSGDDQITFLPDVSTMIYWDNDFSEPTFIGVPGVGAVTYLLTPTDPSTGEEVGLANFTVFVRSAIRPDPESPQEWYEGLTGDPDFVAFEVPPTDIRGMASSGLFDLPQGEFVEIYGAFFFAPPAAAPPDHLLAESPFIRVGDELVPDPNANNDPVLDGIKLVQPTALAVFNAGFVVPTAPTKPQVTLSPGDGQVTVLWDGASVASVNPFAKVARDPCARGGDGNCDAAAPGFNIFLAAGDIIYEPTLDVGGLTGFVSAGSVGLTGFEVTNAAYNPEFVIQDFQGYRVYKSVDGSAGSAFPIAQFDLPDGIVGGTFCNAVTEVTSEGEFVDAICTESAELNIGTDSGLAFAVTDRGGSGGDPSAGQGLINGIPIFYSVTAFAVNPGLSPVGDISEDAEAILNPPPAPLILESGLLPLSVATPRSNASSFANASIGDIELVDDAGNVLPQDAGPMPDDGSGNLTGPIPNAIDWSMDARVIQPLEIPADFTAFMRIDSVSVSPGFAHPNFCGSTNTIASCDPGGLGWPADFFDEVPAGDSRSYQVWVSVRDESGTVLESPTGPAVAGFLTGFISFTGVTNFTGPEIQVLSPINPANGVAFSLTMSGSVGRRARTCGRRGTCVVTDIGNSGALPASVASAAFSMGVYGAYAVRDIEITWSNTAGTLSLSAARDISNNVDVEFRDGAGTQGWGFAAPTGLEATEDALAVANATPRTADNKVLYPDPLCTIPMNFNGCGDYGGWLIFTQAGTEWTDIPNDPAAFDKLAPFSGTYAVTDLHQAGAQQQTAALWSIGGQSGTRMYISGQYLDLTFNSLPADGEQWLIRLPLDTSNGEPPRPPPPGTRIAVNLSGGTNNPANADLSAITVVPNPFLVVNEATRGVGTQVLFFNNLPPAATIRIYTISGNLVRVIDHSDGSGTAEWDLRTRYDLLSASGNYYYHVTTPDGRTHLGRFAVVN